MVRARGQAGGISHEIATRRMTATISSASVRACGHREGRCRNPRPDGPGAEPCTDPSGRPRPRASGRPRRPPRRPRGQHRAREEPRPHHRRPLERKGIARLLQVHLAVVEARITARIDACPALAEDQRRFTTVPGIGPAPLRCPLRPPSRARPPGPSAPRKPRGARTPRLRPEAHIAAGAPSGAAAPSTSRPSSPADVTQPSGRSETACRTPENPPKSPSPPVQESA
jgi:hypothetical protein